MHKRKLIREEIVTILKNELGAVASTSVFESRIEPIFESSKLPAVAVYTREETAESQNGRWKVYERILGLAIEIVVQGNTDSDDSIDAISLEIEAALNSPQYQMSDNYESIEYKGIDVAFIAEGRVPKAAARLNYEVVYITEET